MHLRRKLDRILGLWGYKTVPTGLGYLDPKTELKGAREAGLGLCEYLEKHNVGGVGTRREQVISSLLPFLSERLANVLEIGAGTGMFLERILEERSPTTYQVYETSVGWVKYLKNEYGQRTRLTCHPANGRTLDRTESNSVDAAFSHGVFIYLPLITTFGYLEEMARVVKPGGVLVFDCFLSRDFGLNVIKQWQADPYHYTFPVTVAESLIDEFVAAYGLSTLASFEVNYHASFSNYFVLQKRSAQSLRPAIA